MVEKYSVSQMVKLVKLEWMHIGRLPLVMYLLFTFYYYQYFYLDAKALLK